MFAPTSGPDRGFLLVAAGLVAVIFLSRSSCRRASACPSRAQAAHGRADLSPYQRAHPVFRQPARSARSGWNKAQSQIAVRSGGLAGKSTCAAPNILGFPPRTVAPTDFVFSLPRETGFAGALWTVALFGLLLYGGLLAAARAGQDGAADLRWADDRAVLPHIRQHCHDGRAGAGDRHTHRSSATAAPSWSAPWRL